MAAESSAPSNRLYVGNLPWTFSDADLAGAFAG
jgi:RNA recognition motif-containing protein